MHIEWDSQIQPKVWQNLVLHDTGYFTNNPNNHEINVFHYVFLYLSIFIVINISIKLIYFHAYSSWWFLFFMKCCILICSFHDYKSISWSNNPTFKWFLLFMNWFNMNFYLMLLKKPFVTNLTCELMQHDISNYLSENNYSYKSHIWMVSFPHELIKYVGSWYFFENNCSHKSRIWMVSFPHELLKYVG